MRAHACSMLAGAELRVEGFVHLAHLKPAGIDPHNVACRYPSLCMRNTYKTFGGGGQLTSNNARPRWPQFPV